MKSKQGGSPPKHHLINTAEEQTHLISVNPSTYEATQPRRSLLKLPQVLQRTSLGKTSIYQLVKEGAFPRPLKVGGASLWIDEEISIWIENLMINRSQGSH